MTAKIAEATFGQWRALRLCNDQLEIVIVPTLGGKIISCRSVLSGREWLWTNPHLPQRDPTGQTDYVGGFDTGGWDELFPTVDSCVAPNTAWGDQPLSDHGEIWRRRADVTAIETNHDDSSSISLRVNGEPLPFTFERTLTLAANEARLEIAYRLTSRAHRPLPYIWAAHPLLAIEPGMRIALPDHVEVSCTGGTGEDLPEFGKPFSWPTSRDRGKPLDLSRVPEPTGLAVKLFTQPLDRGWVAVTTADGRESFRLQFTDSPQNYIGMWLNYGGWSGGGCPPYFNVGIEPTTSPCDSITHAIARDLAAVVPPGELQQWTLMTTLTQQAGD